MKGAVALEVLSRIRWGPQGQQQVLLGPLRLWGPPLDLRVVGSLYLVPRHLRHHLWWWCPRWILIMQGRPWCPPSL
jgi:hypothetical protein